MPDAASKTIDSPRRPASAGGPPPAFHLLAKPTGAVCNLDCAYGRKDALTELFELHILDEPEFESELALLQEPDPETAKRVLGLKTQRSRMDRVLLAVLLILRRRSLFPARSWAAS